MNIIDRIGTILKANINDLLDRAEDPEKMLTQLIYDMEETYKKAEDQVTEAMALEKKLERESLAAQALVEQAHTQAVKAVQAGRDDLAKKALARRIVLEKRAASLKEELEAQSKAVISLRSQLNALQAKIEDARQQKSALLARQKRLQAEQTIRRSMADLRYAEDAFAAFDRMKEKIEDKEAILEAAKELEAEGRKVAAAAESGEAVEIELAALKAELGKK